MKGGVKGKLAEVAKGLHALDDSDSDEELEKSGAHAAVRFSLSLSFVTGKHVYLCAEQVYRTKRSCPKIWSWRGT